MMRSPQTVPSPAEAAKTALMDARRRQLLDAAAQLMERSGSHGVSMQSIADEAGVSVGLIYRYFGNKEDLVQAVIVAVLDEMTRAINDSASAETDAVRRIVSVFAAYCQIVEDNREAVALTYRESKTLPTASRQAIKDLEVQTTQPLTSAIHEAYDANLIRPVNVAVFAYDLLMKAHSWALKHWYFEPLMSFDQFVTEQAAFALSSVIRAEHRHDYADLLGSLA